MQKYIFFFISQKKKMKKLNVQQNFYSNLLFPKQFRMRAQSYKLNNIRHFVKPNQQKIIFDMTFHEIFHSAFKLMRFILLRYFLIVRQLIHDIIKRFYSFLIVFVTFKIFFKLRGFPYFLHDYFIESIKACKLSTLTSPASFPHLASSIASKVTALGMPTTASSLICVMLVSTILTPFIISRTLLRCSKIERFSISKVSIAITLFT